MYNKLSKISPQKTIRPRFYYASISKINLSEYDNLLPILLFRREALAALFPTSCCKAKWDDGNPGSFSSWLHVFKLLV
ncbi:hypothetical protein LEP1GSC187_2089 [Leptospira santarosai str. ZUN179]|uniref:Uncharacterized protein n=1 Tax=Leptospira santarosai str. ZUN179 TaxID=1049985 RepID=M6UNI2_9LEPT|nr:hypothetical protein LEP1GSC187_2089 [Leptospira santarosai str. ZUN179]